MDTPRARGLPPKLGIKKRKPRANSLVEVANGRVRKEATLSPVAVPSTPGHTDAAYRDAQAADAQVTAAAAAAASILASAGAAAQQGDAESMKRKGLRHFAVRVSRKVEEKNVTTYNEVADELVVEEKEIKQQEMEAGGKNAAALRKKLAKSGSLVDEKNIRRRVYDSLNVLMAMSIISKDKKLITWRGLDAVRGGGGPGAVEAYRNAVDVRRRALEEKRRLFLELEDQATTLAALIRRNARDAPAKYADASSISTGAAKGARRGGRLHDPRSSKSGAHSVGTRVGAGKAQPPPASSSGAAAARGASCQAPDASSEAYSETPNAGTRPVQGSGMDSSDRVPLPFVIVATAEDSKIELEMDHLREDVTFTFSSEFAALDDREILRRISQSSRLSNV